LPRLAAFALLAGAFPAGAHDAPSGWTYDLSCCSNRDCQPVPSSMVTATPGGWLIDIPPGVHKTAPEGFRALVPWDSPDIRHSPDGLFHPCIAPAVGPYGSGPVLLCLYVPDMGA
jgi:hypothetical protein